MFEPCVQESRCLGAYVPLESPLSQLQNSQQKDPSLRRRLHLLMNENFELKEEAARLDNELRVSIENQEELKVQLRAALGEVEANDQIIEKCRVREEEMRNAVEELTGELEKERHAVGRLIEHNCNLQTEARLMSELKQKYQAESARCRLQMSQMHDQLCSLAQSKERLSTELSVSLEETQSFQKQLVNHKAEMKEYESYVLQKIAQSTSNPEIHQKCLVARDKYYCKYLKYKERSRMFEIEKDELLRHLSSLNQEVGSQSMRKYME